MKLKEVPLSTTEILLTVHSGVVLHEQCEYAVISLKAQEASHLCSSELASQRWSGLELEQRHWDLKNTQILWRKSQGSRHSIMWPPFCSIWGVLNCSPIFQFSTFCNDWWSIFFWIKRKCSFGNLAKDFFPQVFCTKQKLIKLIKRSNWFAKKTALGHNICSHLVKSDKYQTAMTKYQLWYCQTRSLVYCRPAWGWRSRISP